MGGALASPSTAYVYDWNMLPIGQALWLKELETYINFPPLQDPASYNLEQVMQQVKNMKTAVARANNCGKHCRRPAMGIRFTSGSFGPGLPHWASENSISLWTGTDTTLGVPHAVEVRNTPNGVCKICAITMLMTAAIRPSQSNTGAPKAPWSMAKRLSPSYISRRAEPASLPSSHLARTDHSQSVGIDLGRRALRDDLPV